MKQYNIKINEGELNNLKVFLSRVELKGNEAVEYVQILQVLGSAEEEGEE